MLTKHILLIEANSKYELLVSSSSLRSQRKTKQIMRTAKWPNGYRKKYKPFYRIYPAALEFLDKQGHSSPVVHTGRFRSRPLRVELSATDSSTMRRITKLQAKVATNKEDGWRNFQSNEDHKRISVGPGWLIGSIPGSKLCRVCSDIISNQDWTVIGRLGWTITCNCCFDYLSAGVHECCLLLRATTKCERASYEGNPDFNGWFEQLRPDEVLWGSQNSCHRGGVHGTMVSEFSCLSHEMDCSWHVYLLTVLVHLVNLARDFMKGFTNTRLLTVHMCSVFGGSCWTYRASRTGSVKDGGDEGLVWYLVRVFCRNWLESIRYPKDNKFLNRKFAPTYSDHPNQTKNIHSLVGMCQICVPTFFSAFKLNMSLSFCLTEVFR